MSSTLLLVLVGAAPTFEALIAEPSDQPIVLDVFTTWCKPCAAMDKDVFPHPTVLAALSQARFVRYDAERGEGVAVAERFRVSTFPTILVLAPDGTRVGQINAQTPAGFVAQLTPLLAVATVKGPFTDEAVAKKDADARVLLVFGLKTLRGPPPNHAKALGLFERAAARDADGKRGVKWRATALIAATKYRLETKTLKVRTLLELARGDPESTVTINALGALSLFEDADAVEIHRVGERLTKALAGNANSLNELVYAQLEARDTAGALASAKALEALSPAPDLMDTVAEAYFQAGQKERAVQLEEALVRANPDPSLKANLQRFKTEQPSPPPFAGRNPLEELDEADAATPAGFQLPAHYAESLQLAATLADECRAKAGKVSSAWLRLEFTGSAVSRALAFDVEVPAGLKRCLEGAVKKKQVKDLASHSPWTMEIEFAPQ